MPRQFVKSKFGLLAGFWNRFAFAKGSKMSSGSYVSRNLALFIDYENFDRDGFDVGKLAHELTARGRLLIKRAYGDWGRFPGVKHEMLRAGVDVVELPSNSRGKNRADIRLVVDAMETAMTRDHIDTFVIASGDSDFLPLISKLRELNRYVIVVARKENASSLYAKYCDELLMYASPSTNENKPKGDLTRAEQLVTRSLRKLADASVQASLSRLKSQVRELDPAFNEADFGFSQFKMLIRHLEQKGILRMISLPLGEFRIELLETSRSLIDEPTETAVDDSVSIEPKSTVELPIELLDHVAWACRYKLKANENTISLSILSAAARKLFPDFKLSNYGYPREGGWRKLLSIMEQDRWCDLKCDEKNQFQVTFTPEFLARSLAMPEPTELAELLAEAAVRYSPESLQKSTIPASLTADQP
jgi:uncharacterized LabA/DUF88 family protein